MNHSLYKSPGSWPDLGFLISKQWRGRVRVFGILTSFALSYYMIFEMDWGKEDNVLIPVRISFFFSNIKTLFNP